MICTTGSVTPPPARRRRSLQASPLLLSLLLLGLSIPAARGQVVLYENSFESPNVTPERNCGFALDVRPINEVYGTEQNRFHQQFTVETILINDPIYTDSAGTGGNYAVGMLSVQQDDRLALTFNTHGLGFINVSMDVSSIDVDGCGGPFGIAAPVYRITLVDSPGGTFDFGSGTVLSEALVTGEAGPGPFAFRWTRRAVSLDVGAATDSMVTVVWDLLQSGYAAFDNLRIEASNTPVAVASPPDRDLRAGALGGVYPNPFSREAAFSLALPDAQHVRIVVYDLTGRAVASVHDGPLPPGEHRFTLQGSALPGGVYVVRAVGERFSATRRAVLLR